MRNRLIDLFGRRSVQLAALAVIAGYLYVYFVSGERIFLNQPLFANYSTLAQLGAMFFTVIVMPLVYMVITYLITRERTVDIAERAPAREVAAKEVAWLIGYAAAALAVGQVVGQAVWGEGIGLHLHGTLYGATAPVSPGEVIGWATYNFVVYALLPFLFFRRRGYDLQALSLKSSNLRNDVVLIVVVLVIEGGIMLSVSTIWTLTASQFVKTFPISLGLHFFGAALPIMIFVYSLLLPRYKRLTGSFAATTVLGGITYAAFHVLEYWTVYDSLGNAVFSIVMVFIQFFGPGMIKSFLTLRTGNAWVHVWAYHLITPHTLGDTAKVAKYFGIR